MLIETLSYYLEDVTTCQGDKTCIFANQISVKPLNLDDMLR